MIRCRDGGCDHCMEDTTAMLTFITSHAQIPCSTADPGGWQCLVPHKEQNDADIVKIRGYRFHANRLTADVLELVVTDREAVASVLLGPSVSPAQ